MNRLFLLLIAAAAGFALGIAVPPSPGTSIRDTAPVPGNASASLEPRNPVDAVLGTLTQRGTFRQLAQIGDALAELNDEQMADLMNRVSKLSTEECDILLPRLMAGWTQRNPQAATEWIRPILERFARNPYFGQTLDYGDTDLVIAWARNAPDLALEIARQHADKLVGKSILEAAIWARRGKYAEKFTIMLAFPSGQAREEMMRSFFSSWVQSDRNAALAAAASLPPGVERDDSLVEVLAWTAKNDPATALDKYRELAIGNPGLLRVLIHGAATKDPALAARIFEQFNAEEIAEVGSVFVGGWAKNNPAAAFAWAHQQGIAIDQRMDLRRAKAESGRLMRYETEYSYQTPLETAARSQPEALVAFLRSLPAGPERDRYIQQTVLAAADKPAVQAFISELPMGPYIASAQLSRLTNDIPKAEEYVRQLPQGPARDHAWNQLGSCLNEPLPIELGPDRDAMLQGMARRQMQKPDVAWSRLRDIGDATRRRQAFDDLAYALAFPEPRSGLPKVSELLQLPDVPEEYKKPWFGL